jgi:hypothetical protein
MGKLPLDTPPDGVANGKRPMIAAGTRAEVPVQIQLRRLKIA